MHIFKIIPPVIRPLVLIMTSLLLFLPLKNFAGSQEQDDRYTFLKGVTEYNAGNYDNAQKIFSQLIREDSTNDALCYYSANIHFFRGEFADAARLIKRALQLDSSNFWYRSQLARILLASGERDLAVAEFETLRKSYPQKTELYEPLIEIYAQSKKIDRAREIVDDIEKYLGKSEASGLTRYNLLIFENRHEDAFNFLKEFDREWGTPRTATILGDYYSARQNDTLAMEYYVRALSQDPSFTPAIFGQAEIFRIRGDFDNYFGNMKIFLADKSVNPLMKSDYMKQILSSQRFVETFFPQIDTIMDFMYNAHPSDSSVAYPYAMFKVQSGDMETGADILRKNLRFYPSSADAHKEYLTILYYMSQWDSLATGALKALEIDRNSKEFTELLGIAYAQSGKTKESVDVFKHLLGLAKGDSVTTVRSLSLLGDLSYQLGNKREAYSYYRKTLKAEPKHLPALNNYAYYLSEEGRKLKKALEMSKITIDAEPDNTTYLDTYGWILHLLGRDQEAKNILKKCIIYGGDGNATILDHYAEILYSLKEYELATIYWNQADAADPSLGIAARAAVKLNAVKK
ncbi:MAG: tetratricopeptide repeat protein [Bacteroidales bacterium]|nr:tetratricopeptide repeat protein [Bacteroidales bacterium]MDD3989928.1 tetratricopeptide repeat protein [Bacteroidales bacterium]MDD4638998.1 tetratricopeptide repeat protein [Bacteroidales bacterium]